MADAGDEFVLVTSRRRRGVTAAAAADARDPAALAALPRGAHVTAAGDLAHTGTGAGGGLMRAAQPAHAIMRSSGADGGEEGGGARRRRGRRRGDGEGDGGGAVVDPVARLTAAIGRDQESLRRSAACAAAAAAIAAFLERAPRCAACTLRLVAVGLGSLRFGTNTRIQTAFCGLLADFLCGSDSGAAEARRMDAVAWDPLFDADDVAVLGGLAIAATPGGVDAASPALHLPHCTGDGTAPPHTPPTVFYMPHCNADAYDALLAASGDALSRSALMIGNSFASYAAVMGVAPPPAPAAAAAAAGATAVGATPASRAARRRAVRESESSTAAAAAAGDGIVPGSLAAKNPHLRSWAGATRLVSSLDADTDASPAQRCWEYRLPMTGLEVEEDKALSCTRYVDSGGSIWRRCTSRTNPHRPHTPPAAPISLRRLLAARRHRGLSPNQFNNWSRRTLVVLERNHTRARVR